MIRQFVGILLEPLSLLIVSVALMRIYFQTPKARLLVLLFYYITAAVALSIASWMVFRKMNNTWIYNSLYIPAIGAIGYYFYDVFRARLLKSAVSVLLFTNLLYFAVRNIPFGNLFSFDSIGYALLSISVAVLCFFYFYQLLRNVNEHSILDDDSFWIVSALLLYYLGSFFVFLFFNMLESSTESDAHRMTILWGVHNVLLFLSSLIILVSSLWIPSRNK
jgi:hypothetical protein